MSLERMMLAHEAMRQLEHLQQALECDDDELVVRALPHDPPPPLPPPLPHAPPLSPAPRISPGRRTPPSKASA